METQPRSRLTLLPAIALLLVGFALGALFTRAGKTSQAIDVPSILSQLSGKNSDIDPATVQKVWDALHEQYIETSVDDGKLLQGAVAGMVSALGDPYSSYFTASESKELESEIDGTFEGVGMEIGYKNKVLTVIAPLPKTPAERAGIMAGDQLISIDDKSVDQFSLEEAINAIRGTKGTTVNLKIRRDQENDIREFKIVRDTIKVESVTSKVIDHDGKKYGYLKLTSFTQDTGSSFRQQARDLLLKNMDGFIIDLRNNPGGYLEQSIEVGSAFIPSGTIVSTVKRDGEKEELKATGNAFLEGQKVVVLINEGSASASEIVAGALQDTKRATLIGQKTFGKGSVQEFEPLGDGSSLKLTIAKWYTPGGRSISDHGIEPNITVDLTEDDVNKNRDPQLDRAFEALK